MTIREMVHDAQRELMAGDVTPQRGRELLVRLTALLGSVLVEMREADAAYAVVLLGYLDSDEAASRARIRAETSPEYARKRTAYDTRTIVVEMIRGLKASIRSLSDEMQLTR
jgi:hypothetical protein